MSFAIKNWRMTDDNEVVTVVVAPPNSEFESALKAHIKRHRTLRLREEDGLFHLDDETGT